MHWCDLPSPTGAVGIRVWLIWDITKLLTTLDPTHEKKSEEETKRERRRRRKHVETGWEDVVFLERKQVRSSLPKQQQKHVELQLLQCGGLWWWSAEAAG